MSDHRSRAAARLTRDLKELQICGCDFLGERVTAAPVENDIRLWHVVRARFKRERSNAHARALDVHVAPLRSPFARVLIKTSLLCARLSRVCPVCLQNLWLAEDTPCHLVLTFPEEYPAEPPAVEVCTPFPHASIVRVGIRWTVCLDMLQTQSADDKSSTPYAGWSSAMSVLSLLLQLQSFLSDESLQYQPSDHGVALGTMDQALASMRAFECGCPGCQHAGHASPWPRRLPFSPTAVPARRVVSRPWSRPKATAASEQTAPAVMSPAAATASATAPATAPAAAPATPTLPTTLPPIKAVAVAAAAKPTLAKPVAVKPPVVAIAAPVPTVPVMNSFAALKPFQRLSSASSTATGKLATTHKPSSRTATADEPVVLSKAQRKNAMRTKRRQQQSEPGESSESEPQPAKQIPPESESGKGALCTTVNLDGETATATATATASAAAMVSTEGEEVASENAGCFGTLGYDALLILMETLHQERDVRSLACTCKHLASMGEDGMLWRSMLSKHYPASKLSAASMGEWKYAYELELSANADQLTCYHTKVSIGALDERRGSKPEIFGFPIRFTVNPRTREVDYVYSTFETLSYSAFVYDHVRRTVWGESFTHFLPLYISEEHFEAALPILVRTLKELAEAGPGTSAGGVNSKYGVGKGKGKVPQGAAAAPPRERTFQSIALDVLPKLCCTMVVLLVDNGVADSDRLLDGYCQVNRLMLALAQRYPSMRESVTRRVRAFIRDESARTKSSEPNLGVLLPLLAIASGVRWCDLAWPLLQETFDRAVLWCCCEHPELESDPESVTLEQRLAWHRQKSKGVLQFHVGFCSRLAKVSEGELDAFSGNPTPWLRASMRAHIKNVLSTKDSWPAFFELVNVPLPSKAHLDGMLRQAVLNSASKQYHRPGMDFSRVQKSGTSAILRKGESYAASATMRRVRLEEVWRWRGHETLFLDASCLSYGYHGERLAAVDFSNRTSVSGMANSGDGVHNRRGRAAIEHSGDVIEHARSEGRHTIDIDLHALSDKVGSLFVTLSAWTTTLTEIVRPEVRFFDPDDKAREPLTRYELEGKPTGSNTAVVMARIWRMKPGARWHVTAVGEIGKGRASHYEPIHHMINGYVQREEELSLALARSEGGSATASSSSSEVGTE